jgi:hypothetical protein
MSVIEDRVDRLEDSIDRFVLSVGIEFNKLYNSQMRTEAELRAFKEEMRIDRDEARKEMREMNRKWGDLANKLGTLVEDLVYPSLGRILKETLGREVDRLYLRLKQRLSDGRVREFDAIAVVGDLVCLNSTKSTLRSADVDHFVEEIAAFREFLPEYRTLPLIGILASVTVDESVLAYAERQGYLVLAVGDELMEVKNRPGFEPKRFL